MVLHLGAHGFKPETAIDLETQPAPTVASAGFGSFKWWIDGMKLKSKKKFGPDATAGHNTYDLERRPSPAILAQGLAGVSHTQYDMERGGRPARRKAVPGKPPYRVPSMAEINALPWNGLKVVSTFSGCGGSCLGYRMAGFKVVWANEFVPIAGDSYEANAAPWVARRDAIGSTLDRRDVRQIKPEEILEATGLKKGELDLLDGSPPCQAFSTAGKRARGWGKDREYEHGARQKNEDLFYEYIRLLKGLMPRAFVAENVSGLVKGVAKGYFIDILTQLRECGYRVEARLLDAKWLGVPQSRQRIIFVGIREDLGIDPAFPKPLPYFYSVRDALPELGGVTYDDGYRGNEDQHAGSKAAPAVRAGRNSTLQVVGNTNAPHGQKGKRQGADQPSPTVISRRVAIEVIHDSKGTGNFAGERKFTDRPLCTIPASPADAGHFTVRKKRVVAGSFQHFKKKRDVSGGPCPALLTAQPVHYLVENDGSDAKTRDDGGAERRKFTIAELKRICAYPDDFEVLGKYAQQWAQFGNSVPPVMMMHIAAAVRDALKSA